MGRRALTALGAVMTSTPGRLTGCGEEYDPGFVLDDVGWARTHGYGSDIDRKTKVVRRNDPNRRYAQGLPPARLTRHRPALNGEAQSGNSPSITAHRRHLDVRPPRPPRPHRRPTVPRGGPGRAPERGAALRERREMCGCFDYEDDWFGGVVTCDWAKGTAPKPFFNNGYNG
ncbi:hypothetical protein ACOBQB_00810 [Streptomyces sp. G5(2025)]|uniref:hypothetical protein n=1 Tax=Streptomyces sp. G5(2025) TaxID=3406628 RepID=UPI003C215627